MLDSAQSQLKEHIERLRAVLTVVDSNLALGQVPSERMQDLRVAVDDLRTKAWLILKADHRVHEQAFVNRVRARRAVEICEEVIADLCAGAIAPGTPGYSVFRSTVRELAAALEEGGSDG